MGVDARYIYGCYLTRYPNSAVLCLDIQLIGLDLSQLKLTLTNQVGLHALGMSACFQLPGDYRSFIQTEGQDDGLYRAASCQQRDHQNEDPVGIVAALGLGKGAPAGCAAKAAFFLRMNPNAVILTTMRTSHQIWIQSGFCHKLQIHEDLLIGYGFC